MIFLLTKADETSKRTKALMREKELGEKELGAPSFLFTYLPSRQKTLPTS